MYLACNSASHAQSVAQLVADVCHKDSGADVALIPPCLRLIYGNPLVHDISHPGCGLWMSVAIEQHKIKAQAELAWLTV